MVIESDLCLFYLHSQQVLIGFKNSRDSQVVLKLINIYVNLRQR